MFKYYTYLQNILCLIVSIIFCICIVINTFGYVVIPEYIRGFRYVVTTGLVFTSFIYVVLLSSNKNNMITDIDFKGISGKMANVILHYLCPVISLVSFVFFERSIILDNGIWTMLVAIPSCLYWVLYFILTITKVWEEPYDFSTKKNNMLLFICIPIFFIIVSIILWNVR